MDLGKGYSGNRRGEIGRGRMRVDDLGLGIVLWGFMGSL